MKYCLLLILYLLISCKKNEEPVGPDLTTLCKLTSLNYGRTFKAQFFYDNQERLVTVYRALPFIVSTYKIEYNTIDQPVSIIETRIDSTDYMVFGVQKSTTPYTINYGKNGLPSYYSVYAGESRHSLQFNAAGKLLKDSYSYNQKDSLNFRYEYNQAGNNVVSYFYDSGQIKERKQVEYTQFDTKINPISKLGFIGYLMNFSVYNSTNPLAGHTFSADGSVYESYTYIYEYRADGLPSRASYELVNNGKKVQSVEGNFIYECP